MKYAPNAKGSWKLVYNVVLLYVVNIHPVYSVEMCITNTTIHPGLFVFYSSILSDFNNSQAEILWQYGEFYPFVITLSGSIYIIWQFVLLLVLCNATLMMFVKAIETYWYWRKCDRAYFVHVRLLVLLYKFNYSLNARVWDILNILNVQFCLDVYWIKKKQRTIVY